MSEYGKVPFDYWVIDDFFSHTTAIQLSDDFMDINNRNWFVYDNPLEIKKTCNNWWCFPPVTYNIVQYLNSPYVIDMIEAITDIPEGSLHTDPGLHGAGWHIHGNGGKLNIHLDYSVHPKLGLERKYNLILYLSQEWDPTWGGGLELWSHDEECNLPKEMIKTIDVKFNRAVLFDCSKNSWHGFSQPISCPPDQYRKTIAMYYLTQLDEYADPGRKRALYSPSPEQANDPAILKLIEDRVKI